MARGTTLGELVSMYRDEAGMAHTPAVSQNVNDAIRTKLRRVQDQLYNDWHWPFLQVERDEALKWNERYYSFPPDLNPDRIVSCHTRETPDSDWHPVGYGITFEMRNCSDAELGDVQSRVRAWNYYEDGQYEVWPMPDSDDGRLRFVGLRNLAPLIKDGDRADLDDNLIVLFAAGQALAKAKDPAAQMVLSQADSLYRKLKGNGQRTSVFPIAAKAPGYQPIRIKAPGT